MVQMMGRSGYNMIDIWLCDDRYDADAIVPAIFNGVLEMSNSILSAYSTLDFMEVITINLLM